MGKKDTKRFVCGLFKHTFTRRDNLNRHKRKCYSDPARVNGLVLKGRLRTNLNVSCPPPLFPRMRGRPRLGIHKCKKCGKVLDNACKKRDHQRKCRQSFTVIKDIEINEKSPNLVQLL